MTAANGPSGGPILPGSRLSRALDDYPVPPLPAGFAERVLAAAEVRPAPLPELRSRRFAGGWRLGRRLVIGAAWIGVLGSAAAATGLLERFDLPVPSPAQMWASVTGNAATGPRQAALAAPLVAVEPPTALPAEQLIDGPIDTPEELAEAFRRIDEVREQRKAARKALADQRIDAAIARRSAAGLPVPSADDEARLRERIAQAQSRRAQIAEERITARRAELEQKVANGEALTRDDFAPSPGTADRRAQLRLLRQMNPEQRREALRNLPPEQRRAIVEDIRSWRLRQGGLGPQQEPAADQTLDAESALPAPLNDPTARSE